jgi:flavocytochrome c
MAGGQYRILWLAATLLMLGTEYCGTQTPILKCLAAAAPVSELDQYNSNNSNNSGSGPSNGNNPTPSFLEPSGTRPSGQLQDAKCNVEEIEHANDSQLYSILNDLVQTTFFRNFVVDLDHGCPLLAKKSIEGTEATATVSVSSATSASTDENETTQSAPDRSNYQSSSSTATTTETTPTSSSSSTSTPPPAALGGFGMPTDEDVGTCGGGLPDFFAGENDGKAACDIEVVPEDQDAALLLASLPPKPKEPPLITKPEVEAANAEPSSKVAEAKADEASASTPANADHSETGEGGEDEDFECETSDELEDEPLCDIQESDFEDAYGSNMSELTLRPLTDFLTSALKSIMERVGWESESQRNTFAWSTPSDPVVVGAQSDGVATEEACDEHEPHNGLVSDHFWMDMCSHIHLGEGKKVVNLALNPERNTGYNGTHIWKAIYEENCVMAALDEDGHDHDHNENASSPIMCYEERILYRLLSGMQASTSLSIAKNYYPPSKRKGRVNWEPNPQYFMDKFHDHPEYIRNLHFSYVVLLRALRKAKSILYHYDISTGDMVDDESATILLRRLLDSHILKSCTNVFDAFDESLMFQESEATASATASATFDADTVLDDGNASSTSAAVSLQQNFKGVFHNISNILDCVQCQQCKLHGKMTMLGYGTALKILFLPESHLKQPSALSRNEVVAFVNTVAKFSESLKEVRELTHMYWSTSTANVGGEELSSGGGDAAPALGGNTNNNINVNNHNNPINQALMDDALMAISQLNREGMMDDTREAELVALALHGDAGLLSLAKHYASDLTKFLLFSHSLRSNTGAVAMIATNQEPDAIVVGAGLAGLAATLHILDRGGHVVLLEKEHSLGGNSAKASSGMNGCCLDKETAWNGDSLESFYNDTLKSAGTSAQLPLIDTLTKESARAVQWLSTRAKVDLSLLAQLGGHAHKRTHRPNNGMVGAEIIFAMQREVKKYLNTGQLTVHMDTRVTKLVYETTSNDNDSSDGSSGSKTIRVTGVETQSSMIDKNHGARATSASTPSLAMKLMTAPHVILATGGFASDRSSGSYLEQYRPELMNMPATAGDFSTGDGIALATALGAGVVDMDKVQIHPTGWVDPANPTNPTKILAAELMRGVGGMLINAHGKRFCNELGTRAYVADKMLQHNANYKETGEWDVNSASPILNLVLSEAAVADGRKHVDLYTHKGLLTKLEGLHALANWMNVDGEALRDTLEKYRDDATNGAAGSDEWGKTQFRGLPSESIETEIFYAGQVTPVLHYCMGGLTIDTEGNVLTSVSASGEDQSQSTVPTPIEGLHAAGEVSGGVHGVNRLGGNSLLECTVFGTIVGEKIPIRARDAMGAPTSTTAVKTKTIKPKVEQLRHITPTELAQHGTPTDCWVALHGTVYDMTDFAEEHPSGAQAIYDLAGTDGTAAFAAVHNKGMLEEFEDVTKGTFVLVHDAAS